jgi:hypothetical protein
MVARRCPKCTLAPPCQHYETIEDITNEASRIVHTKEFKQAIPASKRETILKLVKD